MAFALCGVAARAFSQDAPIPDRPEVSQPAPEALQARLDEIDARLGKIEQVRARFRQTRTIPMLRRPMESTGTVMMRKGELRWDTLKPAPSTMLLREGEIQIYYPDSAILEIYETGAASGEGAGGAGLPVQARAGTSPRLGQLRDRFAIAEIPASSFENAPKGEMLGLELTPLDTRTTDQVKRVRVLVDTAVPMIRRVQITNAEGELTDIELFDLRFDQPVTEDEMTLTVPAGTLISRPLEGELNDADDGTGDETERPEGGSP